MHQEDAKSSRDKKENGQRDSWKSTNCDLASFFSVFIDNAKKKLPNRSIKQRQGNERNELRHEMLLAEERSTEILK